MSAQGCADEAVRSGMPWLAVSLALGAAILFAIGAVAQQQEAANHPHLHGPRLIARLLTKPRWLAATTGNALGYALQATALAAGSLIVVEPLLVTALVFALPLSARWNARPIRRSQMLWGASLSVALAIFLIVGDPDGGVDVQPISQWWSSIATCGAVVIVVGGISLLIAPPLRALGLAIVAGTCVGFGSALTKSSVHYLAHGIGPLFMHWEPYALIGVAAFGIYTQQLAFQSGPLQISYPATMILDPVVAVFVAVNTLDERVQASGAEWILIGACAVVLVCGTIALARARPPALTASAVATLD
jgi:hypothetical protein